MTSQNDIQFEHFFLWSADLLCIAGYDGFLRQVNPALCKRLGYSMMELQHRPILDFLHPEDYEKTKQARLNLQNSRPLYDFENRYITKSGETIWLSWTSIPIPERQLIYAIAKDITAKKLLENHRNDMIQNLNQRNKALQKVNYMTSHDLRSCVSNLQNLYSLLDLENIDPENREIVDLIADATEELKVTLSDYIDELKRNSEEKIKADNIYLYSVLQRVLENIKTLLTAINVKLKIDFSEAEMVYFSKTYLYSIFLNLISNSIKYATAKPQLIIAMKSSQTNSFIHLEYKDNGIGFDAEKYKERIFQAHQQAFQEKVVTENITKDSKGLGLYLLQSHMDELGGKVSIHSRPGHGIKVDLYFPKVK
tara:strand:- start:766 stop:1863 length:1098 start_codon:yes stop_codon:yes gene_type:complete